MTAPDQQRVAEQPRPSGVPPALADIIDIRNWIARQDGEIPHTPAHLVNWLHDLVAAVAAVPEVTRMAWLTDIDGFRRRFSALLIDAVGIGWATHNLTGVELFERYAHDQDFRAELHATAGIAAYTAVRADTALPGDEFLAAAVIAPRRQQVLTKAIEDHAPRYHATVGSPARYIAEGHVPGGATSAEWNWIAYYIAAHPEVLQGPVLSPREIDARNRIRADELDRQALAAFEAGDHQRALEIIDEAELHDPRRGWDAIRAHIREQMNESGPAGPEPVGAPEAGPGGPTAGTAFPHPRNVPGERAAPPTAAPGSEPVQRGAHR